MTSSSAEMKTLHDLPPEMLCAIFEHLSLGDSHRYRTVCKLWNELLASIKIKSLFVDAAIEICDIDFILQLPTEDWDVIGYDLIEGLQIKHYDQMQDVLVFVRYVNYSLLFDRFDVLPDNYFMRFPYLQRASATCPLNEKHFLDFLKKFNFLKELCLYDSDLSQQFFDSLKEFCWLSHFLLLERNKTNDEESETELDFTFLSTFKNLFSTQIEKKLSAASKRSLIAALNTLKGLAHHPWYDPADFLSDSRVNIRNGPVWRPLSFNKNAF